MISPTPPASAAAVVLHRKAVMVPALGTFEGEYLRSGAAAASLVGQLHAFLVAPGTEPALDAVELLFFLFEVVDIGKDRPCQNDDKEEQKIDGIDGSLLRWYSYAVLLCVLCSRAYAARQASRNFSGGVCVLCVRVHV